MPSPLFRGDSFHSVSILHKHYTIVTLSNAIDQCSYLLLIVKNAKSLTKKNEV